MASAESGAEGELNLSLDLKELLCTNLKKIGVLVYTRRINFNNVNQCRIVCFFIQS